MLSYNQSVLEQQLSKGMDAPIGWPWKLFMLSVVVFSTVAALYLGLNFGFKDLYLKSKNSELDENLKQLELKEEQRQNLVNIHSQMANIAGVLKSRNLAVPVLEAVQANALRQVNFATLNVLFGKKGTILKITGSAPSFESLSQQLEVFKSVGNAKEVVLNSSSIDSKTNRIKFTMTVSL